jgi:ankyrin repeat protein
MIILPISVCFLTKSYWTVYALQTNSLCTRDGGNRSALHLAVVCGNLESLDCLVEAGANLSARDRDGSTPLHYAVANNKTALALHLVEKGADVNIPNFK